MARTKGAKDLKPRKRRSMPTREELKNRVMASGDKPGQWSAFKAMQLSKLAKKHGVSQDRNSKGAKNLKAWKDQKWKYRSKRSKKGSKFLPAKAWDSMSTKEKNSIQASKTKANKAGKQFSKAPKKVGTKISKYWKEGKP